MSSVFWIASFPRSGNTWLRFLLTSLLYGPITHSDQVANFVQDVHHHNNVRLSGPGPKLLKTHWLFHDRFPFLDQASGAVYLVRHPADVLESVLNFYLLSTGKFGLDEGDQDRNQFARALVNGYLNRGGLPRWIESHIGRWPENVDSWTSGKTPFPCMTIRYEDLRADPVSQLRLVCAALGVVKTDADMERAVADASIKRMAEIEEVEIAAGRVGIFNNEALKGRANGYRQVRSDRLARVKITADERRRAVAANKALCERFGYTTSN